LTIFTAVARDMIKIEYPPYQYKIKNEAGKDFIFDPIRRIWVVLTPEEWVRQNFLQYLVQSKGYSPSLIAVEKKIRLGELIKRCDIVIYTTGGTPSLIVECKEMGTELNEPVLNQILRYNMSIPVPYLVITNGTYCFAFERTGTGIHALSAIPALEENNGQN